jgi:GR25 family glycosyltransferase involved in LPS biosynthesis
MRLWDLCVLSKEPIIIFEADALMTRKYDVDFDEMVVGLNDPRGTTRRADVFHERVSSREGVQVPPTVNRVGEMMPQGLAGHSAYYIKPEGAKQLLDNVKKYGMWPNDAYMCKELFPWIRVVYPYFTKVQGTASTTTR